MLKVGLGGFQVSSSVGGARNATRSGGVLDLGSRVQTTSLHSGVLGFDLGMVATCKECEPSSSRRLGGFALS